MGVYACRRFCVMIVQFKLRQNTCKPCFCYVRASYSIVRGSMQSKDAIELVEICFNFYFAYIKEKSFVPFHVTGVA